MKDINPESQEALQIPSMINTEKITHSNIIVRPSRSKDKEKIMKVARGE